MKKLNIIAIILLISSFAFAQSPFNFNYQAVARDAQGQALKNQSVNLRISLLDGGNTGTSVYTETHQVTSSNLGIINLLIGKGQNQTGSISNLDWKTKKYWLKVEMDATGGSNYTLMGTTQLVSVPYALHAETATYVDDADANPSNELQQLSFNTATNELSISNGNKITIPTGGTDADADPLNEIQTISKDGNTVTLSKNGGTFIDEVDDADSNPSNELQQLSFNNATNELSISNGNKITISTGGTDADADPNNEIQTVSKSGNTVTLSKNGGSFTVDDADADPNNELQQLSFNTSTNQLTISNGNSVTIPTGGTDADADPNNEIQTISKNGNTVTLSKNGGSFTDEVVDADADPNNEIQTISKNGNTVTLSKNGGSFTDEVDDADADNSNEKITSMTLSNTNILTVIEPGNTQTVDLSSLAENSSLWTESGSNIYRANGKVGVQTNTPYASLSVGGSGHNGDAIYGESSATNGVGIYGYAPVSTGYGVYGYGGNYDFYAGNPNGKSFFNGNIGIGIENPNSPLHIKTKEFNTPTIKLQGSDPWVGFYNSNDNLDASFWYDTSNKNLVLNNDHNDGALKFQIRYFDKMVISKDGDVGIGTSEPQADFHIKKAGGDTDVLFDSYSTSNATSLKLRTNVSEAYPDFLELKIFSDDDQSNFPHDGPVANSAYISASGTNSLNINSWSGPIRFMYDASSQMSIGQGNVNIENFDGPSSLYLNGNMEIENDTPILHFNTNSDGVAKINVDNGNSNNPTKINIKTESLQISKDGSVLNNPYPLSVTQPAGGTYGLYLTDDDTEKAWEFYISDNGDLQLWTNNGVNSSHVGTFNFSTGAYTTISDIKAKTNIHLLSNTLESVLKLQPSKYEYKLNNPSNKKSIGFIAQDVQRIFPELIHETPNSEKDGTMLTIDYAGFGVIAIKAIQEQQKLIESQNKKLTKQQNEIENLKLRLQKIEKMLLSNSN